MCGHQVVTGGGDQAKQGAVTREVAVLDCHVRGAGLYVLDFKTRWDHIVSVGVLHELGIVIIRTRTRPRREVAQESRAAEIDRAVAYRQSPRPGGAEVRPQLTRGDDGGVQLLCRETIPA